MKEKQMYKKTLANGLEIVLMPDYHLPIITLVTAYHVGSKDEEPGATGIAHLFEHMMFNGSKNYPAGQFDTTLESGGGYSNAFTTNDMTVYYDVFPKELLSKVLDMEQDRMANLLLTDSSFNEERKVVMEERRLRDEDSVEGILHEAATSLLYRASSYRWPVSGWMEDLKSLEREDLIDFYEKYYAPNNATLILAGDFDEKMALSRIENAFGELSRGKSFRRHRFNESPPLTEVSAVISYPSSSDALIITYQVAEARDGSIYAGDVLASVLGEGEGSILYKALVTSGFASSLEILNDWREGPGYFSILARIQDTKDPEEVKEKISSVIKDIIKNGINNEESERGKNLVINQWNKENQTNEGRALHIVKAKIFLNDCEKADAILKSYRSISSRELHDFALKFLGKNGVTVILRSAK